MDIKKKACIKVVYRAKNRKCVSLKPISFVLDTGDFRKAEVIGLELLQQSTEYWNRYKPTYLYQPVYGV